MSRDAASLVAAVQNLHAKGLAANEVGQPARAAPLLVKALEIARTDGATDPGVRRRLNEVAARVLVTLANTQFELTGFERAMELLGEAAAIVDRDGADALRVSLHNQRGLFLLRAGDSMAALHEFDLAESWFDSAAVTEQCRVLLNRGTVHLNHGTIDLARADLQKCADLASGATLEILEFKSLHNLGYLEFLSGDLPKALRLMANAKRHQDRPWGIALLDHARVLDEAGMAREADEALAEAAAIFRRDRLAQDLGETELERARCALINGDVVSARMLAGRARDRFRRRATDRWRRNAELVLLQSDLAAGRPGSRLTEPALRLQAEFAGDGLPLLARAAGLIAAEAYLSAGQPSSASVVLSGLGRPGRGGAITGRMHYAYVHARLEAAQGSVAVASRRVRAGLAELSAYQSSFGSIDLQTASAVHGRRLAELGVELSLAGGRPATVLAAAERARAVSSRLPTVRPPEDPVSAELLAELRQTVEALRPVTQDRDAAMPLLRRRRDLERQITARRWTLAGTGDVRPTARIAEIRGRLGEHDAGMVVYVEAAGTLHAVATSAGRMRLHSLGSAAPVVELVRRARADLDVLAGPRLPGGLRAAVRGSFERSLDALDAALITPLRVDGRRLVIVSTGVLGQLPWGALPSLRGVPVVVAPSATAWLAASESDGAHRDPEVIAIAGPDLARAEDEVAGIRRAWANAHSLAGAAADRSAVASALAQGSVVHLAAHGVHQTENPLFSSLRLADGPMFAHELDQTARTPEHVILSACELGLATVRPGDEALGLTSVLLHLGTRSVVAGVARVGDEVAAETMLAYHRYLAAGRDSAAALAEALVATDWAGNAPFVCFGSSWAYMR